MTSKTIVIPTHEPTGATVPVKLPAWRTPVEIPVSDDIVTVEISEQFAQGNFAALVDLFPEDKRADVRKLHVPQLQVLMQAWAGGSGD